MSPSLCLHMLTSLLTPPSDWHFPSTMILCCVPSPPHEPHTWITSMLAMLLMDGRYNLWVGASWTSCLCSEAVYLWQTEHVLGPERRRSSSGQTQPTQLKAALFNSSLLCVYVYAVWIDSVQPVCRDVHGIFFCCCSLYVRSDWSFIEGVMNETWC